MEQQRAAQGQQGCGGILLYHMGKCLAFFANSLGECHAIKAELIALKKGHTIARELGVKYLEVLVDNMACSKLKTAEPTSFGQNQHIAAQCKKIMSRTDWIVILSHFYREANRTGDWLANRGVENDIPTQTDLYSLLGLVAILHDDISGATFTRIVRM
ncbi:hypothetical protein RDABS01_029412 [Bienertia sinuspersici]